MGTANPVDETTLSLGDATTPTKAANTAAGTSTFVYFLRMILVLALVLAAIYVVYRLMKRAIKPKTAESSAVKVLASTSIGPGKALHVISVGSKAYLLGATDSSINLVAEVEDKEFIDALALEAAMSPTASRAGAGMDFGGILAGLLGARRPGAKKAASSGDFLAGQRERLRKF